MVESDDDDDNMGSAANDVPGLRRAGDENGGDGGGGGDDYDDDTAVAPDSEEEGEDLIENAHQDYQAIEELDRYDESMLDERQNLRQLDQEQRAEVEAELDRRDNREDHLASFAAGADDEDEDFEAREARRRGFQTDGDDGDDEEFHDVVDLNLEAFECSLREWIAQSRTRRAIKKKFRDFLTSYTSDDGRILHRVGHAEITPLFLLPTTPPPSLSPFSLFVTSPYRTSCPRPPTHSRSVSVTCALETKRRLR